MDTTSKAIAKRHDHGLSRRPRRLRTVAEKRRIVEETLEPGASVSVVAQAHDVNANLLFGWRKLYRAGLLTETGSAPALVPVRLKRQPTLPQTALEIILAKGTIRLSGAIDARLLKEAIEALA